MNNLYRELAPVSAPAWQEIEKEAKRTLKTMLAGRRIVDFVAPQGFATSAVGTGRTVSIPAPPQGAVEARLRQVQPLVEIRAPFELPRSEIEAIDRGATDSNLDTVIAAARKIAIAEDVAIFHGYLDHDAKKIGLYLERASLFGCCRRKRLFHWSMTGRRRNRLVSRAA